MSAPVTSFLEIGKTLLFAARDGDLETVVNMLYRNAPYVNDWLGSSPLHLACKNNHEKIVEALLNAGISKDSRTKTEKTPLHFAAFNGRVDIVEMLLTQGAKPNCTDMLEMTPLHWACQNQHYPCVKVLLYFGADVDIVNKFGKTAASIAEDLGRADISNLIRDHLNDPASLSKQSNEDRKDTEELKQSKECVQNENEKEKETSPVTEPKTYARKKTAKSQGGNAAKRKKVLEDDLDRALPLFRDSGSLSPSEAERQARTMRLLETHGIKMLPNDDSTIVASAVKNGQTVCLTEAGKMALKAIEIPSLSPSSTFNNTISRLENPAPSPEKPSKKSPSKQLVHINSLNLANKKLEGKRIIKIRADQLINMKKNDKVLIRPSSKSVSKILDTEAKLKEALNALKMDEPSNSFRIEESDFDDVVKQLSASQALVKLYRQQLIKKEKELQLYKQLLLQTNNQLKTLQQTLSNVTS